MSLTRVKSELVTTSTICNNIYDLSWNMIYIFNGITEVSCINVVPPCETLLNFLKTNIKCLENYNRDYSHELELILREYSSELNSFILLGKTIEGYLKSDIEITRVFYQLVLEDMAMEGFLEYSLDITDLKTHLDDYIMFAQKSHDLATSSITWNRTLYKGRRS